MSIITQNVRDLAPYQGDHAIPGIRFRAARQALGISAWGMNVLELDPGCDGYPEHDHRHDGQEELYVVLEGSLVLVAEGTERTLVRGDLARVPPDVRRKLVTRSEGATVLALGGTPGQAYAVDPRLAT
jgi:uncharacterized cupin superfamily protein